MQALQTNLVTFINQDHQFIIPIYQRTYSWANSQCKQLWNDIVRVSEDDNIPSHFIGSVVYIAEGLGNVAGINQFRVIDGQQRLTTISLLFLALKEASKRNENTGITSEQIGNQFLVNQYAAEESKKIKLCLTRHDKDIFNKLVVGQEELSSEEQNSKIYQNFQFFVNQI